MADAFTALALAKRACDTMMRRFAASELPPQGRFHYHQGVFLNGMYRVYELTGDERYFDYIKAWVDAIVDVDGRINRYDAGQLDDLEAGTLLFPLYRRTGDPRYRTALDTLIGVIRKFPRNAVGGFWHKDRYPNQMWLDGLYMGGPLCTGYARAFDCPALFNLAAKQAELMRKYTRDPLTGLWKHAWDCSGVAEWAERGTGLSPEFWGRSVGWVTVALLDELNDLPAAHPARTDMEASLCDLLRALCRYQSASGRWYQVLDKGDRPDNWLENSCSCLFASSLARAVQLHLLDDSYMRHACAAFDGVADTLRDDGDDLLLGQVCVGTGVGDYAHYIARPTSVNDLHGVGAFLLMCTAVAKALA